MKLISRSYSSLDERKEILKKLTETYGSINKELTLTGISLKNAQYPAQIMHSFIEGDNETSSKVFCLVDNANCYNDDTLMKMLKKFKNDATIAFLRDSNNIINENECIITIIDSLGGEMDYINTELCI